MKLILIGFMGAGKSTVAQVLSQKLGCPAWEMDEEIRTLSGFTSISELFAQRGEAYFRALETLVARSHAATTHGILSTGGGVVGFPENLRYLRSHQGRVIFLRTSFSTVQERLQGDPSRPLFADADAARQLFDSRAMLYEAQADQIVDTDGKSPEQIAAEILQQPEASAHHLRQLCVIVGDPVAHSLSPRMHNAAYRALGLEERFVFTASRVAKGDLRRVVDGVRSLGIRGLTCTIPHKIDILPLLDQIDPQAEAIGAVNTVVQKEGKLWGTNTDWLGIARPLERFGVPASAKAAILGAGGTTRAALVALQSLGIASCTVFNRTLSRAQQLAREFGCEAQKLEGCEPILAGCDIIIQTTSVGMSPDLERSPVSGQAFREGQVVFDAIYTPFETRFLQLAQAAGAAIVRGAEMFVEQGIAQFEHYTGAEAPRQVMKDVVYAHFGAKDTA